MSIKPGVTYMPLASIASAPSSGIAPGLSRAAILPSSINTSATALKPHDGSTTWPPRISVRLPLRSRSITSARLPHRLERGRRLPLHDLAAADAFGRNDELVEHRHAHRHAV